MSENKHTPGPWQVVPGFSKFKVYGGEKYQGHFCIADCHQFDIANDQGAATIEKEANARLISAAPDLLKALKMLYQWVQVEVEQFEAATPDDFIIEAVEAAIKKAEEAKK